MNEAVRQHQGRPRGATRRRRRLHGGDPGHDRLGRLADDGLRDPRRRPFFCGTYFPPRPPHGDAGFGELCQALAAAWEEQRDQVTAAGRASWSGTCARRRPPRQSCPTMADLDNAVANLVALHDDPMGRVRRAPKFPQPMAIDLLLAPSAARETRPRSACRGRHPGRDGRRRHLRPPRRRVRPLLGRQHVARPPLREDAVRPGARASGAYLHAGSWCGLERHREVVDGDRSATCSATCGARRRLLRAPRTPTPTASRAASPCGHPTRSGPCWPTTPRRPKRRSTGGRSHDEGNFEGVSILHRLDHPTEQTRPPAVRTRPGRDVRGA